MWSHTDFDALVIHAGEPELTRRVVHAYADTLQPWMDASDGQTGRKLAGLVRRSRLQLDRVHAHQVIATELDGDARARIDEIVAVLSPWGARGGGRVEGWELERWHNAVASAAEHGAFFYAETAFLAISHRPQ